MSLAALAASPEDSPSANASAADVTEVLTQQFSAAKTGTKAPINTPVDVTGEPAHLISLYSRFIAITAELK